MSDLRPQEEKTHMHSCLVVQPIHEDGIRRLEEAGITARYASNADMATVAREIGEASAVITRDAGLTAEAIGRAARLAVIANHGIGTNKIDVAAAGLAGIPIVYTPHANARSVADSRRPTVPVCQTPITQTASKPSADHRSMVSAGTSASSAKAECSAISFFPISISGFMGASESSCIPFVVP